MRVFTSIFSIACVVAVLATANASDHLDSPLVMNDGRLDVNDSYIFQSPDNTENTVMIMTVNPAAGIFSPMTFNPSGTYEFNIDSNGDAVPDVTYSVRFGKILGNGEQRFTLRRNGALISRGQTGTNASIKAKGGGTVACQLYEDPFFFDLEGFNNGFMFTGNDFFAGLNVSAIVIEVPSNTIAGGTNNVSLSCRTLTNRKQFDRVGRPAINTVLISPSSLKDMFNVTQPVDDPANYGAVVQARIEELNGGDSATAAALAGILLPDVLTVDLSDSAGFLNGRRLADDVIDAELGLLTNGALTTDMVDANDVPFLTTFPYLAPAND